MGRKEREDGQIDRRREGGKKTGEEKSSQIRPDKREERQRRSKKERATHSVRESYFNDQFLL
jgi:hypothetical protein